MRNRLLDSYRQPTIKMAQGQVLEIGVGSGLNLRFYSRAVDRVCGIDLSPELLRLAHTRTADAVVPVSLIRASAEHLIRRRGLRYDRNDVDVVLNRESARGAHRDTAGSQTGRGFAFRRARSVAGTPDCSLAALVNAVLETDRRWLPSRPQDGRPDPCCGVSNQRRRNQLYEGAESLDFHVSGIGDELI